MMEESILQTAQALGYNLSQANTHNIGKNEPSSISLIKLLSTLSKINEDTQKMILSIKMNQRYVLSLLYYYYMNRDLS